MVIVWGSAERMDVIISNPELERVVTELVERGAFRSASALVEQALTEFLYEPEPLTPEDVEAIAEADAEFERGEYVEWDVVKAELRDKFGST